MSDLIPIGDPSSSDAALTLMADDQRRLRRSLLLAERQNAESLSLLETLHATAPVGFGFVDCDFRMIRANEALAENTGIPMERLVGHTLAELMPELWPELHPLLRRVLAGETVLNRETITELPGDPEPARTWLTNFYPVCVEGDVIGTGIVVVDITERKATELRLKDLSERDPLTGLYNRRQLFFELDHVLSYAERYDHVGAVLMLDIDSFKFTNDAYGHTTGDRLLNSVAHTLLGRMRETDIVGRLGGDEFAVVLPEATEEDALKVALELRSLLSERPTGPPVTVSIGIAMFGASEKLTADDVLVAADIALYQVKEAGGDQAGVYAGRQGEILSRVKQLREALAEKRFVLHAQPIIDLRSGRVAHRELLIRMLSPNGAVIPPGDFLPIAERFSLVGELDRWVVGEALVLAQHESVTVNLSARSIGDPRILEAVREATAANTDPTNLTFEITETAMINEFQAASAFVAAIRELGCELALDDFGTGFGSFTYLKHLPARYLKIDMEFVRAIDSDPTDREIVRSIVGIAHTLGKETIAEGVESAEALQTLRELGVDYAQGFYLGRPVEVHVPHPAHQRAA
jgi:diguanylate cyclase (GGDEF)-like protein/PAS domain S-box-containing protein